MDHHARAVDRPVLVLDFGSQYVQLIARRVRERHAFARIVRHDLTAERIRELNPLALILSGGPASVYEPDAPRCDPRLFELDVPVLGICYGMQLACEALGGRVESSPAREYGRAECRIGDTHHDLFRGVPDTTTVWMSHGDQVQNAGAEFVPLAATHTCPVAAVQHRSRPVYGLQFHPEVAHTPYGALILGNFLDRICHSPGSWTMGTFLEQDSGPSCAAGSARSERVVCGLSGGVDSAVTAALLARALGPRVVCIFVDNGLLRAGERGAVIEAFGRHSEAELRVVDASAQFLEALRGVTDPQEKRVRIGHTFIDVFRDEAKADPQRPLPGAGDALSRRDRERRRRRRSRRDDQAPPQRRRSAGRARLRADRAAARPVQGRGPPPGTGARPARGDGLAAPVPRPRPGRALPGRGDRPIGSKCSARPTRSSWKSCATPASSARSRRHSPCSCPSSRSASWGTAGRMKTSIALRAVETDDFMTADWSRLPHDVLARASTRIINAVKGVNRVVYDVTSKPPGTIEWE